MVELDQGGRLAGRAGVQVAPDHLVDFMEASFVLPRSGGADDRWRIVPDLSAHLLLHLEDDAAGRTRLRACLVGSRTHFTDARVRRRRLTVGVRLTPGATAPLIGASATDLIDGSVELTALWPVEAARLLAETSSVVGDTPHSAADVDAEALRAHLVDFLGRVSAGRRAPDWRVRGFVAALREGGHNRELDACVARLGVATRTLRRTCRRAVGFGPKRMARIERLYRGIGLARVAGRGEGGRLAAAAGFADQSHMIREFHALVGESPQRFMARGRGGGA